MGEQYRFTRDAGPEDWRALPRKFKAGDIVMRFHGHTYGLDRDDMMYGGVESIPCTLEGMKGFFTVPVAYLEATDGKQPMGDYIKLDAEPKEPITHTEDTLTDAELLEWLDDPKGMATSPITRAEARVICHQAAARIRSLEGEVKQAKAETSDVYDAYKAKQRQLSEARELLSKCSAYVRTPWPHLDSQIRTFLSRDKVGANE